MPRKEKGISIDQLARMVQRGFEGIEEKMATKEELKHLETDIKTMGLNLSEKIDGLGLRITAHAGLWDKELVQLQDVVVDLSERVNALEDKMAGV